MMAIASAGMSPAALQLAVFAFVSVSVATLLLALMPRVFAPTKLEGRLRAIAATGQRGSRTGADADGGRRRRVEDTLRELEAKQRAKEKRSKRPTLIGRMRQGGIAWSRNTYLAVSIALGLAGHLVVLMVLDFGLIAALGSGVTAGLLLPHLYVARKRGKRLQRFAAEFPNSLDVIVRGVRAGLPLVDCLKIIGAEAQEPVRSEFNTVLHDQTLGMPLDEALERLAERVPLTEASFFSIVLAIQSRAGGNLSEALGNLSKVLRDRKTMRAKIKSMSAEAKASAGIIGSIPFAVSGLLYLTSPEYIALLFTTGTGNITLAVAGVWMLIGTLVMRKMINFDF